MEYFKLNIDKLKAQGDIEGLIRILSFREEPYTDTRLDAVEALAEFKNEKAVEPLIKVINEDLDGGVRLRAIWALGEIKDKRAFEPLIKKLRDIEAFWRPNVVSALGELGDQRAVEPLKNLLRDGDLRVSRTAAEALDKILSKK